MSILTLILELLVVLILILIGYYFYRSKVIDDRSVKTLSVLVVNAANPALLINAALTTEEKLSVPLFLEALALMSALYAILGVCGLLIPWMLGIPKHERYSYEMLTVYGNCGFIGFPVCKAVLGPTSLVYASINCLIYNIVFYTISMYRLRREAIWQAEQRNESPAPAEKGKSTQSLLINAGTVSAVLTIILYLVDIPVPSVVSEVVSYVGGSCVFLSMIVLGCSIAQHDLRSLIAGPKKMWIFLAIRMLVLPIVLVAALRPVITDPLMLGSFAILVSLPGGNLPLMTAEEMDLDTQELSRGIVLSTALCVATIPIVCAVTL